MIEELLVTLPNSNPLLWSISVIVVVNAFAIGAHFLFKALLKIHAMLWKADRPVDYTKRPVLRGAGKPASTHSPSGARGQW